MTYWKENFDTMHRHFIDDMTAANEIKRVVRDIIIETNSNNTKIWYFFASRNHAMNFGRIKSIFYRLMDMCYVARFRTSAVVAAVVVLKKKQRTIQTQLTLHRNIHGRFFFVYNASCTNETARGRASFSTSAYIVKIFASLKLLRYSRQYVQIVPK